MRFFFVLSRTFKGLWSNKVMATALALVTFISLLFTGGALLVGVQVPKLKDAFTGNADIGVFLCSAQDTNVPQCIAGEVTEDEKTEIEAVLDGSPLVEKYALETKDEALARMRESLSDENSTWTQSIVEDDMQESYQVVLEDFENSAPLVSSLEELSGVYSVQDPGKDIKPIVKALEKLKYIAAGLAVVMGLTALMLIPTMIHLSALSRKNETEIMRYVGASNFFVKLPFILEGMLASLVGGILSVIGLVGLVFFFIRQWFSSTYIVSVSDAMTVSSLLIIPAVILAGITSWLSLRNYAKA
ncbi:MAG: permease-like cell division protein FtsX [Actinomycetaceae bacterium]|nr:permease-like cell division protein FtsX [Actinomycetaceae bacterium]